MPFKLQLVKDDFIDSLYSRAMEDLKNFYGLRWERNTPKVFIVPDRQTINALQDRETEPWFVGWADNRNVYLLDRENFESDSNHKYSDNEYRQLLKHEISHMFFKIIVGSSKPRWLNEGISLCVSGQIAERKQPAKFKNFLDYYDKTDSGIYKEAGFVVKALINKFGKKAFAGFLKRIKGVQTEEAAASVFKEVFGLDLDYPSINALVCDL